MFQSSAEIAIKVEALVEALGALSPGQTLSYTALSRAAGEPVTGGSYVLRRALRQAERQTGALFDNVIGQGYRRLPTPALPGIGKKANARIRKQARRTRQRLETVRANDMSGKEIAALAAYRAHFGMIEGLAREQTVQAIRNTIDAAAPVSPKDLAKRIAALMAAP